MKPILFSTPMVQAILDGLKTQTRRVVCPQNIFSCHDKYVFDYADQIMRCTSCGGWVARMDGRTPFVPRNQPGDTLWVRETWIEWTDELDFDGEPRRFKYKADLRPGQSILTAKWRPSIHMPRAAARLFLRVTDVRVERLQEINEADAIAEGIPECAGRKQGDDCCCATLKYIDLWNGINSKRGYGWDASPWVWVYTFERIEEPED